MVGSSQYATPLAVSTEQVSAMPFGCTEQPGPGHCNDGRRYGGLGKLPSPSLGAYRGMALTRSGPFVV